MKEGQTMTCSHISEDVNKHHFGNTRTSIGGHDNPNEAECNHAAVISTVLRLTQMKKGNCSELKEGTTQMTLEKKCQKFKA